MTTPFRDEQVALLERVTRLQDELREARDVQANHARVVDELRELTARIERARTRGDASRADLDELSAAVARIREGIDPAFAAREPEPADTASAPATKPWLAVTLGAGAMLAVGAFVLVARHEDAPKDTKPVDPTSIGEARIAASRAGLPASGQLLSMKAWYVSSDGMLHANPAYAPMVEYAFAEPPKPAASAPRPVGAPADPANLLQRTYTVTTTLDKASVEEKLTVRMHAAVPDPHCRLADVWKAARAAGAPAEAVAVIDYEEGLVVPRGGAMHLSRVPRWHFEIATTPPFKVDVSDPDCRVMR